MARFPYFAHAALTEALHEPITSQLARDDPLVPSEYTNADAGIRQDDDEQVREAEREGRPRSWPGWLDDRRERGQRQQHHRRHGSLPRRRAATTAYRGGVGTTTLKVNVQTDTQDNPTHESGLAANGCRNSAAAIP